MLRTSVILATLGTLVTAALTAVAAACILDLEPLPALLLGSTVAATDAAAVFAVLRGSTLRAAARPHARGRVGPQRPDRDPARDRLHRGDPGARATACSTRSCWRSRSSASALVIGLGGRLAGGLRPRARAAAVRRPVPGGVDRDGRARLRRRRHPARLRASSSVYLAGLVLGTATTPARRTIVTFHDGVAWIAQLALFLILGLLVFPEDLGDDRARGHRDRPRHRRARPAAGDARRDDRAGLHRGGAARARLGRPARRGPGRVRDLRGDGGDRGRADVLQRHVLRRAALDRAAGHDDRAASRGCSACAPTRPRSPRRWSSRCCSTGSAPR